MNSNNNSVPIILKLDESVINKIAAGEVIQKPNNAIKELIENSIDALATDIIITINQGGLKLIQIQDNGCGIRHDDLAIVCERFTTSKLKSYNDLTSINTYGFRGEALASMSYISNITITTRTKQSSYAYKAKYINSKLVETPKLLAGNIGTIISIENIFYNMINRRQACMKSSNEIYKSILDIIMKYSIHYSSNDLSNDSNNKLPNNLSNRRISFTCKRIGHMTPDYTTNSIIKQVDVIKLCYGNEVSKELIDISIVVPIYNNDSNNNDNNNNGDIKLHDEKIYISGKISNVNYSNSKKAFILFINNRLVDNSRINKLIDSIYSMYLPKHTYPFIYLSIYIPSRYIDVNISPTKKEVRFLYEDEVLIALNNEIVRLISRFESSRSFPIQLTINKPLDNQITTQLDNRFDSQFASQTDSQLDKQLDSKEDEHAIEINIEDDDFKPFNQKNISNNSTDYTSNNMFIYPTTSVTNNKISTNDSNKNKKIRTDYTMNTLDKYLICNNANANSFKSDSLIDLSTDQSADVTTKLTLNVTTDLTDQSNDSIAIESNDEMTDNQLYCIPSNNNSYSKKRNHEMINGCQCCSYDYLDEQQIANQTDNKLVSTSGNQFDRDSNIDKELDSQVDEQLDRHVDIELDSINQLYLSIQSNKSIKHINIFKQYTYIGLINQSYSLIQFQSFVYLINHYYYYRSTIYQCIVKQFGKLDRLILNESIDIKILLYHGILLTNPLANDIDINELIINYLTILSNKSEMLNDYYSIHICISTNRLISLPNIIPKYTILPELVHLAMFFIQLVSNVNWSNELECLYRINVLISQLYSQQFYYNNTYNALDTQLDNKIDNNTISNLLYPSLKSYLIVANKEIDDDNNYLDINIKSNCNDKVRPLCIQITEIAKLYKIFERC